MDHAAVRAVLAVPVRIAGGCSGDYKTVIRKAGRHVTVDALLSVTTSFCPRTDPPGRHEAHLSGIQQSRMPITVT